MELEKNIYGLSEGVFKACQFLGLKFPKEVSDELKSSVEHMPSDYFGDDFELDEATKDKLCSERKWSREQFEKRYKTFSYLFYRQKPMKKNNTDLNIYFCDQILFAGKKLGSSPTDYFDFEFYNKSFAKRREFRIQNHHVSTRIICNDPCYMFLLNDKCETNKLFNNFLGRDWLDTRKCSFKEFKAFVEKHPRFFSKPFDGSLGKGAKIIHVDSNANLETIFINLKSNRSILEEIVSQHEEIAAFCPDVVNTIRVYSILDIHNVVHIVATSGRFGRAGGSIDNFHGGGVAVVIDPITGIITSDGINEVHERMQKHPDSGKTFKGFQYPCWEKVRYVVEKMARMIPQLRHIGWDITVNDQNEAIIIEANGFAPDLGLQQAPDDTGRLHLYNPLLEELWSYKKEQMRLLGYRVNNLQTFDSAYELNPALWNPSRKFAISKLIPDCTSLIDLGCRKEKSVKTIIPAHIKYYPADFKKHDDEVIVCDFNKGEFPNLKTDVCLCVLTAEFVELLPQFLANMCNAAQKQILMWCRPADKERNTNYRWSHPFLTDFTEEFLIKTMEQNNFKLNAQYPSAAVPSIILYDFRRIDAQ